MACEKYSSWMIEAALDALSPQRQAEFSVHIAECRRCREEFQRLRAVSGAVDRGIEALVASEPSPHFEAKLRARLAAEPTPQLAWRFGWAPVGALAAALIAAVAFWAIRNVQTPSNLSHASFVNSVANVDTSKTRPAVIDTDAQHSARSDGGEVVSEPASAYPKERTSKRERLSTAPPAEQARFFPARGQQPEVLIPPGQFAMIERFAEAAREGRIDSGQIAKLGDDHDAAPPEITAAPLEVNDVEISPLKIQALSSPSDSGSSASPDSGKS